MNRAMRKRMRATRSLAWTIFDRLGPRWTLEYIYRGARRGREYQRSYQRSYFQKIEGPARCPFTRRPEEPAEGHQGGTSTWGSRRNR